MVSYENESKKIKKTNSNLNKNQRFLRNLKISNLGKTQKIQNLRNQTSVPSWDTSPSPNELRPVSEFESPASTFAGGIVNCC